MRLIDSKKKESWFVSSLEMVPTSFDRHSDYPVFATACGNDISLWYLSEANKIDLITRYERKKKKWHGLKKNRKWKLVSWVIFPPEKEESDMLFAWDGKKIEIIKCHGLHEFIRDKERQEERQEGLVEKDEKERLDFLFEDQDEALGLIHPGYLFAGSESLCEPLDIQKAIGNLSVK